MAMRLALARCKSSFFSTSRYQRHNTSFVAERTIFMSNRRIKWQLETIVSVFEELIRDWRNKQPFIIFCFVVICWIGCELNWFALIVVCHFLVSESKRLLLFIWYCDTIKLELGFQRALKVISSSPRSPAPSVWVLSVRQSICGANREVSSP